MILKFDIVLKFFSILTEARYGQSKIIQSYPLRIRFKKHILFLDRVWNNCTTCRQLMCWCLMHSERLIMLIFRSVCYTTPSGILSLAIPWGKLILLKPSHDQVNT